MSYEIELKAWVHDFDACNNALKSCASFIRDFEKKDTYFHTSLATTGLPFRVRIRNDNGIFYATYKTKKKSGNMEINKESEFTISDSLSFETMLYTLGMKYYYSKKKKGHAYQYDSILCELCHIEGLGDILELEYLAENPTDEIINQTQQKMMEIFTRLSISSNDIESKHYSEMLAPNLL